MDIYVGVCNTVYFPISGKFRGKRIFATKQTIDTTASNGDRAKTGYKIERARCGRLAVVNAQRATTNMGEFVNNIYVCG